MINYFLLINRQLADGRTWPPGEAANIRDILKLQTLRLKMDDSPGKSLCIRPTHFHRKILYCRPYNGTQNIFGSFFL